MKLNELKPAENSTRTRKRVGRGESSGWGKTCGRAIKGRNPVLVSPFPHGLKGTDAASETFA